jgi:hypothetical protein
MISPIRRHWSPSSLFKALQPTMFSAPPSEIEARKVKLWKDLYTEYDARHFELEVIRRDILETADAKAFFSAWAADERRHTTGFVSLMQLVCSCDPQDLWDRLDERSHDFNAIGPYLIDEFTLLVLLAFDEMATCHAYAEGRDFYAALGQDLLLQWLREVIADEAVHCTNALNVIRSCHSHRIPEMKDIMSKLITPVPDESEYRGTFVLDHFGAGYSPAGLVRCRDGVLRAIARPASKGALAELSL